MAKLNWESAATKTRMWRHGIGPATDIVPVPIASKKRKSQKRTKAFESPKTVRQDATTPAPILTKRQKHLAEELRVRKLRAEKVARKGVHEASVAASHRKRQAAHAAQAAAQARALAKKQKRLAEEQRVRKARAARTARKMLHEAQTAAAQQKRRERQVAVKAALITRPEDDPNLRAKQAAEIAGRLGKRMKSVVVVRKRAPRHSAARAQVGKAAKPSSPLDAHSG